MPVPIMEGSSRPCREPIWIVPFEMVDAVLAETGKRIKKLQRRRAAGIDFRPVRVRAARQGGVGGWWSGRPAVEGATAVDEAAHHGERGSQVVTRRSPFVIELSASDRAVLEQRARAYTAAHHEVVRAKIVLMAAAGLENTVIAARLDVGGAAGVEVAQAVLPGGPGWAEGSPADRSAAGLSPLWRW